MKNESNLRPVLKWAGGKRSLLSEILEHVPTNSTRLIEPFVGGGAVLWAVKPNRALIGDLNSDLIGLYESIRNEPDAVIKELKKLRRSLGDEKKLYENLTNRQINKKLDGFIEARPRQQKRLSKLRDLDADTKRRKVRLEAWAVLFEEVRAWDRNPELLARKSKAQLAARMIFLNHLGFNGLYRVNSKNQFNVPFGRYDKLDFFDESLIRSISEYLSTTPSVKFFCQSFEKTISQSHKGDFIYADPPYAPLDNANSTFTSYTKDGFAFSDLERLLDCLDEAAERGSQWLLSNVKSKETENLFKSRNYVLTEVSVARPVNSDGNNRGNVIEYLVLPKSSRNR